jgi:uncharacterized repeat protein (TIGR03803 family)
MVKGPERIGENLRFMRRTALVLSLVFAGFAWMACGRAAAQSYTNLYNFTALVASTNPDGAFPVAGLILSGTTLYGTASLGGNSSNGTVFKLNTNGTGFTTLHHFTGGSDGAAPVAGLVLGGNTLYGTASSGGISDNGTVFGVSADGTGFTNLHGFTGSDGTRPAADLILSGSALYGTTSFGGNLGNGTVFKVNTNSTGFTNLHKFTGANGAYPQARLVVSGNTLFGTTERGGASDQGTVFKINTDGTGFASLHSFNGSLAGDGDGSRPTAGLVLSGNTLYGAAQEGGQWNFGTLFKLNTDGTGFTNLHVFTGAVFTPSGDGGWPTAGLILSGTTLYGTARLGGGHGYGLIFKVNTDGTGFAPLYSFTGPPTGGSDPFAGLVFSGSALYGMTKYGGSLNDGTVFRLSLPPPLLTFLPSGGNFVVMWPADAAGFSLQSAPAITGTFTNVPGATSPYTNPVTGPQKYFRLIAN